MYFIDSRIVDDLNAPVWPNDLDVYKRQVYKRLKTITLKMDLFLINTLGISLEKI